MFLVKQTICLFHNMNIYAYNQYTSTTVPEMPGSNVCYLRSLNTLCIFEQ